MCPVVTARLLPVDQYHTVPQACPMLRLGTLSALARLRSILTSASDLSCAPACACLESRGCSNEASELQQPSAEVVSAAGDATLSGLRPLQLLQISMKQTHNLHTSSPTAAHVDSAAPRAGSTAHYVIVGTADSNPEQQVGQRPTMPWFQPELLYLWVFHRSRPFCSLISRG